MSFRRASLATAFAALALAALPGTAAANDLFTLDPNATSAGHVIEDAAGNAYVAWVSEGVPVPRRMVRTSESGSAVRCAERKPSAVSWRAIAPSW